MNLLGSAVNSFNALPQKGPLSAPCNAHTHRSQARAKAPQVTPVAVVTPGLRLAALTPGEQQVAVARPLAVGFPKLLPRQLHLTG